MGVSIWEGNKAERVASALEVIAVANAKNIDLTNMREVQEIVRAGKAREFFSLGDQIDVEWKPDNSADTTFHIPFDVVAFHPATDPQGNVHENAMWIQSHYALTPVQFSGNNAFYVPTAELPAGTYHFSLANSWGKYVVAGKSYQFTLTQAVPAGGQLLLGTATSNTSALPDTDPANWRVRTFANGMQDTPTEIVALTEGASGTDLGALSTSTKYAESGINNMQRAAYGYDRYSHSAIRQWLNSAGSKGEWWEPKNPFDHRPDQLATVQGLMAGLPSDFLAIIKPVKMVTALNTVSDTEIGASEETADKFFLPSLEQEFIVPQASGEGDYWPYWKERLGLTTPQKQGPDGVNPHHIRYAYENHTAPQYVRLRSCSRGYSDSTWYVSTSGYASYGYYSGATHALRPCPGGVIY